MRARWVGRGEGAAATGIWHSLHSRRHLTDVHVFDHIAFVSFDK